MRAQAAAQSRKHNYIGQEHILLGLAAEPEGMAAMVLNNLGLSAGTISEAVDAKVGEGLESAPLGAIGLTPRVKRTIELAVEAAKALNHSTIGTEHLLIGMMAEGTGVGVGILKAKGITEEAVRAEVGKLLDAERARRKAIRRFPGVAEKVQGEEEPQP